MLVKQNKFWLDCNINKDNIVIHFFFHDLKNKKVNLGQSDPWHAFNLSLQRKFKSTLIHSITYTLEEGSCPKFDYVYFFSHSTSPHNRYRKYKSKFFVEHTTFMFHFRENDLKMENHNNTLLFCSRQIIFIFVPF